MRSLDSSATAPWLRARAAMSEPSDHEKATSNGRGRPGPRSGPVGQADGRVVEHDVDVERQPRPAPRREVDELEAGAARPQQRRGAGHHDGSVGGHGDPHRRGPGPSARRRRQVRRHGGGSRHARAAAGGPTRRELRTTTVPLAPGRSPTRSASTRSPPAEMRSGRAGRRRAPASARARPRTAPRRCSRRRRGRARRASRSEPRADGADVSGTWLPERRAQRRRGRPRPVAPAGAGCRARVPAASLHDVERVDEARGHREPATALDLVGRRPPPAVVGDVDQHLAARQVAVARTPTVPESSPAGRRAGGRWSRARPWRGSRTACRSRWP